MAWTVFSLFNIPWPVINQTESIKFVYFPRLIEFNCRHRNTLSKFLPFKLSTSSSLELPEHLHDMTDFGPLVENVDKNRKCTKKFRLGRLPKYFSIRLDVPIDDR